MSRIVMLLMETSSSKPPSTVSRAMPRQSSTTQLLIVMLRNPPLLSVPNLIRPITRSFVIRPDTLVGGIEERSFLISASDVAIGDSHVIGGPRVAECVRTLRANPIIPGCVHAAVRNPHIAAAIYINTVAIGI